MDRFSVDSFLDDSRRFVLTYSILTGRLEVADFGEACQPAWHRMVPEYEPYCMPVVLEQAITDEK